MIETIQMDIFNRRRTLAVLTIVFAFLSDGFLFFLAALLLFDFTFFALATIKETSVTTQNIYPETTTIYQHHKDF